MRSFQKNIRDVLARCSRKVAAMNWAKAGNDEREGEVKVLT